MTRRGYWDLKVNPALADVYGDRIAPQPPYIIRGPRGGLYVATEPPRFVAITEAGDDFIRNERTVRYAAPIRYVRPGSRLFQEVLGLTA